MSWSWRNPRRILELSGSRWGPVGHAAGTGGRTGCRQVIECAGRSSGGGPTGHGSLRTEGKAAGVLGRRSGRAAGSGSGGGTGRQRQQQQDWGGGKGVVAVAAAAASARAWAAAAASAHAWAAAASERAWVVAAAAAATAVGPPSSTFHKQSIKEEFSPFFLKWRLGFVAGFLPRLRPTNLIA